MLTGGVTKHHTTLNDGRELIYYDDPGSTLGPERAVDARTLDPRPATATMRQRAVRLVMATHPESPYATTEVKRYVRYGASPRAGQACIAAAKIAAALAGRIRLQFRQQLVQPLNDQRQLAGADAQAAAAQAAYTVLHHFFPGQFAGIGHGNRVHPCLIIPKDRSQLAVLIELKAKSKTETTSLESLAETALKQIDEKHYPAELTSGKMPRLLKVAIAFQGKQLALCYTSRK